MRMYVVVLMVAALLGCARSGGYVEPTEARQVARAKTGKEVIKKLGPPSITIPSGNGKTMWVYAGVQQSPSLDSFIPIVGVVTGRDNQVCSQLTLLVDDKTGAVSDMKYTTSKDTDWHFTRDQTCRD